MPHSAAKELADLARLAREGGLDLSQVSLRVTVDLLLAAPRPRSDDLAAFCDLALAVIPTVDDATALILARKLAGWRHAPPPVLLALKQRGGAVLVALLQHGLPIDPAELEAFAEQSEPDMLIALAGRRDLTPAASAMLVEHDIEPVDLGLIGNAEAPLPRAASDILIARARRRIAYHPGLLARRDLSNLELAPLFLQAGAERRQAIIDSIAAYETLHPAARRADLPPAEFSDWLTLARDDIGAAFAALSTALGGGGGLAQAMLRDASRELAALALVGAGAKVEDATRFLIRLGDEAAHSVERIFALVALMRTIRPLIARRLVLMIAGEASLQAPRRGQHQPVMDPSGTASRGTGVRQEGQPAMSEILGKIGPRRERN